MKATFSTRTQSTRKSRKMQPRKLITRLLVLLVCLAQILPALPAAAASSVIAPEAANEANSAQSANAMIVGEVFSAADGLPLAGASVRVVVPGNPSAGAVSITDGAGRYRLPVVAGAQRVRIEANGYTTVERAATALAGQWVAALDAYLTPLDANAVPLVSVVGGQVTGSGRNGASVLSVPPGALANDQTLTVTPLESIALAGALPLGWSPIAAADVAPAGLELAAPVSLNLPVPAGLPAGATLVAVQWDAESGAWIARATTSAPTSGGLLPMTIETLGQYAFVIADSAPLAPAAAVVGSALEGIAASAVPQDVTAEISPAPQILLTGEDAQSLVSVKLHSAERLPSGTLVEVEAREKLEYLRGSQMIGDTVVRSLPLYAAPPGAQDAPVAQMLLGPSLLIAPHDLRVGTIDLAVTLPDTHESGALVARAGTTLSSPSFDLNIPRNAVQGNLPARLRALDLAAVADLMPEGLEAVAGGIVDLWGGALALGGAISAPVPAGVTASQQLALVRLHEVGGETRLDLIGPASIQNNRLRATGVLRDGRYLFVRPSAPLGYVTGTVADAQGMLLAGIMVTANTYPLISLSGVDGRYILAGPSGAADVVATNLETRDTVKQAVTIGAPGSFATVNLSLSATGPVVISTVPAANAQLVPITATVRINFSEALDPASVTATSFTVSDGTATVPGAMNLAPGAQAITFVPTAFWSSNKTYTMTVSGGVKDLSGNNMGADYVSSFRVVNITPPPAPEPGQITATIPDETGNSTVAGTVGTADPNGLVLVRNKRNAALTTATPNANGSFSMLVPALLSDKFDLILRDASGNETKIALPRFQNADGSTVVGADGGTVVGEGGVAAVIDPGSLPDGTVVKVESIAADEMPLPAPMALSSTLPYVGGLELEIPEGVTPTKYIDLVFPAPADASEEDIVFVTKLMTVTQIVTAKDGTTSTVQTPVWALMDRASLEDGNYVTASPPFPGAISGGTYGAFKTSYIITAGPNGELDTMPWRPTSDDELEDRPVLGRVVAPGPDGILQTEPMMGSDDEKRPECVSFVTMEAHFGFQIGVFSVGLPYFFPVVAGSATISGFCNQQMEVTVVAPDTGATVARVTRNAPAGRNEIFTASEVLSDDTTPPTIESLTTPTRLFDDSETVDMRFSERMRQTTFSTLAIKDGQGQSVAGRVISTFGATGLSFIPNTPFRMEEPYTIHFETLKDLAGNAVALPPLTFRRAAPQSLGSLRSDNDLFSALARCPGGTEPCYVAPQGIVMVGDLLFIANGVKDGREYYLSDREQSPLLPEGEGAMLAVVNIADPANPTLVGWHRTFTDPRALRVVREASFPYTLPGESQEQQFNGDLLVLIGGGRPVNNINTASKLEVYDVTPCFAGVAGNCLAEPNYNADDNWQHVALKSMKFLSTALNGAPRQGVPPDMGVALDVEVLHQQISQSTPNGPRRKDTIVAYVGVVPIGIESIDLVKAFGNANSTANNRFAIDGLYRGDFFDLAIMKNGLLAAESPLSGSERLKVFSASLYPLEEVNLPRAFRVAAGESLPYDLDDDGNLGVAEENDGDATDAIDEIFDLAFVSGTPRDGVSLGELYIVDVSHLTDLEHDQPLTDFDNMANSRIVSRIPLPGYARGVCVDVPSRIAYVSMLDAGVAMVDLNHVLAIAQGQLDGDGLIDENHDLIDDRVLYVLKSGANPLQGVNGAPCVTFGAGSFELGEGNGTFAMNWELTGPEFYGSYGLAVNTPVRMKSDVDTINNQLCQAAATIDFSLTNAASVTVRIAGQIIAVPGNAVGSGQQNVAMNGVNLAAGTWSLPIPPDAVNSAGEIPFTVNAVFQSDPLIEQQEAGTIIHDIVMRAALPVGHTMIEGVDLWDGHLTVGGQDLTLPGRGVDLAFSRTWSSAGTDSDSPLGAGWSHNLDVKLIRDGCGRLVVVGGEGTGNAFADTPATDAARAALFNSPLFPVAADALWYPPQVGYHSTLVRAAGNLDEFDYFTKSHVRYHFKREGMIAGEVYTLRFIEDPNGNRLTFDYTGIDADATTLDIVRDSGGRSIRLNYSAIASRKRVVEVVGEVSANSADLSIAPNINIKMGYDTLGNLVAVTRTTPYAGFNLNDQRVEQYGYAGAGADDPHNMTSYTDPNGKVTTYVYYDGGNAPGVDFPSYDPQFGIARHEFIKQIEKPEGVTIAFGYTLSINPAVPNTRSVSDPRPNVPETIYTLDNYGATTRVDAPMGNSMTMLWCTDLPLAADCPTRDAIRIAQTDALGREYTYTYDDQGNVTESTLAFGLTPAAPLLPALDAQGTPVAEIRTSSTHDPIFNRVTSETDAEGNTTWYCLDSKAAQPAGSPCAPTSGVTGNLLAQINAEGERIDYTYYPNGDVKTITDPNGKVTTYTGYDRFGNATRVEQPEGNWAVTVFDARSRVRETTDSFGHHTRVTYDGLDRVIKAEQLDDQGDGGQTQVAQTLYLPGGQIFRTTNGLGQVTEYTYDDLNRKESMKHLSVAQAQGPAQTYTSSWTYDEVGNVLTETDARGTVQTHTYNALSQRLTSMTTGANLPAQGVQTFAGTYDVMGNTLSMTDLHGFVTTFKYDALLRLVETVLPYTHTFVDVPFQTAMIRKRYDLVGNVVQETDANGNPTRYEYDNVYRLTKRIAANGAESTFAYDDAGNATEDVNGHTGLQITRTYDGLNRVKTLTQTVPNGAPSGATATYTTLYAYDDAENAVIITDARGFKTVTDNDGLDRLYQIVIDPAGLNLVTTYTYDANGNLKTTKDAQGGDIDQTVVYDGLNRRIRITYAATPSDGGQPVEETFAYDGANNVTSHINTRGIETRFTYDGLDRTLTQTLIESISNAGQPLVVEANQYSDAAVDGIYSVTTTDANGNATIARYNAMGYPVEIDDALNDGTLTFEWDAVNQRVATDKKGQAVKTTFDELNRPLQSDEYDAGGALQSSHTTAYNNATREVTITDRRGNASITEQDALGRVVAIYRTGANMAADYGSATVLVESFEYDGNNNTVAHVDGRGGRTEYVYDGAERMTQQKRAVGTPFENSIVHTYDAAGNLLTTKDGRASGAAFDVKYTYDARYRSVTMTNGENETTAVVYDAANNVVKTTDALGGVTTWRFDEFNQMLSVDDSARAQAGSAAGVTLYAYDANRNLIAQQDANGNLTTWGYDALDRQTDRYQHTVPGALTTSTVRGADPKGASLLSAAGGSQASALHWAYGYDANNNPSSITDARGQSVTVAYDYLNRPLSKTYNNAAEANLDGQLRSIVATWDPNSNPLTVTETKMRGGSQVTESTTFTYDAFDRVQSRTRQDAGAASGLTVAYDYDVNGNRISVLDPDNIETGYSYDALNRLLSVETEAGSTTYQWWEDDLPKAVVYPNGTWQNLSHPDSYDSADRLTKIESGPVGPATPFSVYAYTYDDNGNRTQQVETQQAMNGGAPVTTSYTYDKSNRLLQATYGAPHAGSMAYTYDAVGNRLTEQGTNPATGAPVNRSFHYTALAHRPAATFSNVNTLTRIVDNLDASKNVEYEYDLNLNQTAKIVGAARTDYKYDVRDQMIAATVGAVTTRFDYDATGMRTRKITGGDETRYLYDENSVLLEYNAALQTTAKYDYGYALIARNEPNAVPANARADFYMLDALGSTANLADKNGTLAQSYRYDAWGNEILAVGASNNDRKYTGHYRDGETGLDYMGARYYDPETGRFLSQDSYAGSLGAPPSLHKYLYANANPLRYVDPTGYASVEATGGGVMTAMGGASESTGGRRGYYSVSAKGEELNQLKGWINDENPHRAGEVPVDENAMTGAWAGDFARRVAIWAREKEASLDEWAYSDPTFARYIADKVGSGALQTFSAMADTLKLGEGIASGLNKIDKAFTNYDSSLWVSGVGDILGDGFRLVDAMSYVVPFVKGAGAFAKGAGAFGKSMAMETIPGITKKLGQKMLPMTVVAPVAERAIQKHVRDTGIEISVRAVDPITSIVARITQTLGWSKPKPMDLKAKTIFGLTIDKGTRYHSDMDIGWARATRTIYAGDGKTILIRKGAYLTDDQVKKHVVEPLNLVLPESMHFQHGAHFSSHKAFGGTLNMEKFGEYPGHPGPISVFNGATENIMSIRQVEQYAKGGNRLPWHPDWDKKKAIPFQSAFLKQTFTPDINRIYNASGYMIKAYATNDK